MTVLLLISFLLRIYAVDTKDMWVDEAHVWWHSQLPLIEGISRSIADGPRSSAADPLYGVLLHFWMRLTGQSLFAMRFLSVLSHILTVAYLIHVTTRTFGWRTGHNGGVLASISPILVLFSQEIRPYALTAAIMLLMLDTALSLSASDSFSDHDWVKLAVGEVLALYTHGFMLFAVLGINIWLAVVWLRLIRLPIAPKYLGRWLIAQAAAVILVAPMIPIYFARMGVEQNPFFERLAPWEFASGLWSYLLGLVWEQRLASIPMQLSVVTVIVLTWLAMLSARKSVTRPFLDLIWFLGVTSLAVMLYSWNTTTFHGRYVMYLVAPFTVFCAAATHFAWLSGRWGRILAVSLTLALVANSAIGLESLYTARYSGYDHHASEMVSETLRAEFDDQDGIIVLAVHDYTLQYYGYGDADLVFANSPEGVDAPTQLVEFMQGKDQIGTLRLIFEREDAHRQFPFYLERYGSLVGRRLFNGYVLQTYQLDPEVRPEVVRFDSAHLIWGGLAAIGQSIQSGDAVTVAMQFRATDAYSLAGQRVAASVRLIDPLTGWVLSDTDVLLLNRDGHPTDVWHTGEETVQYFILPLQPGTPPIDARVSLTLCDTFSSEVLDLLDSSGAPAGQQANLGAVRLGPAPQIWAYGDQRPWQLAALDSEDVAGYVTDAAAVAPGGTLAVTLGWLRTPDFLAENDVRLELVQGDTILAEDAGPPLQGRTPADVPDGQLWLDRRLLRVSRDAVPGPADLIVWIGDSRLVLTQVEIESIVHITEHPAIDTPLEVSFGDRIRLLGYRLEAPEHLTSADTVMLTLYWQALADGLPESNFKVFTQILGEDGRLVGQHDGVPVYESRPFNGWLAGEYLTDEHPMVFIVPYVGPIRIQIGLYDPVTLQRLLTDDGRDAIILPVNLTVESGE